MSDSDRAQWRARVEECAVSYPGCTHPDCCGGVCDVEWDDARLDAVLAEIAGTRGPAFYIVFDGPPDPVSGRFVEVETDAGKSVDVGTWAQRDDGMWSLGPFAECPLPQAAPPPAEIAGNHPAIPESSPATDHAALAAFGAKVLGTFSEYWGDVDGSDLQEWAIETGCLVGHAKQPLPYGAPPIGAYTGVCNGQLCTGETEPGDVCYHRPPAIAATVARLTGGPDA